MLTCTAAALSAGTVGANSERVATDAIAKLPLRLGCPARDERVGRLLSFSEAVSATQRVLYREIAHFQGRSARRTATNSPVVAVVMDLGYLIPPPLQGQRQLLARATKLCGRKVAAASSAVLFDDALNIVCCLPPITLFVVRTDRSLRVYSEAHP